MVIDGRQAGKTPARGHIARVKEQCAFDRAFPSVVHCNFGDSHRIAPMTLTGSDRGHFAAAHERELLR